jgi:hypothetical protein
VAADAERTATSTERRTRASCLRLASQTTRRGLPHDKPESHWGHRSELLIKCLTLHQLFHSKPAVQELGSHRGERSDTRAEAARICSAHPCAMTAGARHADRQRPGDPAVSAAAGQPGPESPTVIHQDNAGVANTVNNICEQQSPPQPLTHSQLPARPRGGSD